MGARTQGGRPPLGTERLRRHRIVLKLNDLEVATLAANARHTGLTRSEFIRRRCLRQRTAERLLPETDQRLLVELAQISQAIDQALRDGEHFSAVVLARLEYLLRIIERRIDPHTPNEQRGAP